jgi:DNA-binding NarL/FixJ family response regulator
MKILIVEDHPLFVEGLRMILDDLAGDSELFCAQDAKSAMETLEQHADVDLILLDIGLPDADGRALIKIIRNQGHNCPLLVVSASENLQTAQEMIQADAQGYVLKSSPLLELRKAVDEVLKGRRYIPQEWEGLICEPSAHYAHGLRISGRQLDVLFLLAQGHSNKTIAGWLGVSEHTVKSHVQGLFDTLGVRNRTACVREAERLGLLETS